MSVQINIGFEQLLEILKSLPKAKLNRLLTEIKKEHDSELINNSDLEKLLLSGPVATKRELEKIEQNRNEINKWRTI